jgi:hypothetical protein
MNKAVSLAQSVQSNTRPSSKVILANLIVPDGKSNKGELFYQARNVVEYEFLSLEVDVNTFVRLGALFVVALTFMPVIFDMSTVLNLRGVDVDFDLDVGPKAFGRLVVWWQGDVLGGEEGNG